ncbi:FHA domain-containing protein [Herpetosiphon geysericola]|uniref:FHA domain-containing protein n=1 Tax=Herpetosiphon geysericola TaxID=70996 RepID=UPI0009FB7C15|nr:FHA domain-containing protein [Herpetosiphon geysericola]
MNVFTILICLCWGASVGSVTLRVVTQRAWWEIILWLPPTIIFGPIGALIYYLDAVVQTPHSWPKPKQQKRPDLSSSYQYSSPIPINKAKRYLYVDKGIDRGQLMCLPSRGSLLIRRTLPEDVWEPHIFALNDMAISRIAHCRIMVTDAAIRLEDVSTNGTEVNGVRIHHTHAILHMGSIIRMGATVIVINDCLPMNTTGTQRL